MHQKFLDSTEPMCGAMDNAFFEPGGGGEESKFSGEREISWGGGRALDSVFFQYSKKKFPPVADQKSMEVVGLKESASSYGGLLDSLRFLDF